MRPVMTIAGHHRAQLARHPDAHQAGHVDRGPELLQLDRAHEREHRADEEAHEGNDADRRHPGGLDRGQQVASADAGPTAKEVDEGQEGLAHEVERVGGRVPGAQGLASHARRERVVHDGAGAGSGRNGPRELQELPGARREPAHVHLDAALSREPRDGVGKGDERAVPLRELVGIEHEAARRRSADLARDRIDGG